VDSRGNRSLLRWGPSDQIGSLSGFRFVKELRELISLLIDKFQKCVMFLEQGVAERRRQGNKSGIRKEQGRETESER
jgi:hypothetical protein